MEFVTFKEESTAEYLELEEEPAVAGVEAEKSEIVTENWTQTETFQLIALYKEHESSQLEDEPRANFWKFIQSELERDGIYKTLKSVKAKWSNLIRTYKHAVLNKKNKKEPKKFHFYRALDELLKYKSFGSQVVLNAQQPENDQGDNGSDEDMHDTLEERTDAEDVTSGVHDRLEEETHFDDQPESSHGLKKETAPSIRPSLKHWRGDYYSNKIDELEDRRRFRNRKLDLAFAKEQRKNRLMELKEKRYELDRMRYELDKRKFRFEERKLELEWSKAESMDQ